MGRVCRNRTSKQRPIDGLVCDVSLGEGHKKVWVIAEVVFFWGGDVCEYVCGIYLDVCVCVGACASEQMLRPGEDTGYLSHPALFLLDRISH